MNPLTPYLSLAKPVLACVVLSVAVFGGCRWQARNDAGKLEAKAHELMVCQMDRATLADALDQVNAKADQAKREAAIQANKAADAVKAADKAEEAYERDLAEAERELQRAGKTPACRAQLEAPLCAPLL